jgi:hypothetical protein
MACCRQALAEHPYSRAPPAVRVHPTALSEQVYDVIRTTLAALDAAGVDRCGAPRVRWWPFVRHARSPRYSRRFASNLYRHP